jgi:small subunit ribosomal protein S16
MVRIRLRRTGLKNQSSYRIVAADKESPRDGRFLEILGFYNPRSNPPVLKVEEQKIYEWMQKGAQPTESALKLFNSIGLMDRYARLKAGEKLETLLTEAQAAAPKASQKPKTVKPKKVEKPVDAKPAAADVKEPPKEEKESEAPKESGKEEAAK